LIPFNASLSVVEIAVLITAYNVGHLMAYVTFTFRTVHAAFLFLTVGSFGLWYATTFQASNFVALGFLSRLIAGYGAGLLSCATPSEKDGQNEDKNFSWHLKC
jgi:hypothetical protein